jgi:hypothetical protein
MASISISIKTNMQTTLWLMRAKNRDMASSAPVADVGERLLIGDVVNQKNAHGAAIVSGGDGAKPLLIGGIGKHTPHKKNAHAHVAFYLAGGVPNLQFAALVVDFDSANLEIDADGSDEGSVESVIRETEQQTALAYTGVSY